VREIDARVEHGDARRARLANGRRVGGHRCDARRSAASLLRREADHAGGANGASSLTNATA
jgi:hypothetical protein